MGILNTFETKQGDLVAIVKFSKEAPVVINRKGEMYAVDASELHPASLLKGGEYNNTFLQVAIGGLASPPFYKNADLKVLPGFYASLVVTPVRREFSKVAEGLPNPAFLDRPPNKVNRNKMRRYDETGRPSSKETGYLGPQYSQNPATKSFTEKSESEAESEPESTQLEVGDALSLGQEGPPAKRIVLEWNNPPSNVSVEQIQDLFKDETILPEPDVIKIQTPKETITHKKESSIKPNHIVKRGVTAPLQTEVEYYGLSPIMARACPKCGSVLVLEEQVPVGSDITTEPKVYEVCKICGYKRLYEGSLPGQGVAGQTPSQEE